MKIKVAAFTVSEKSIITVNVCLFVEAKFSFYNPNLSQLC